MENLNDITIKTYKENFDKYESRKKEISVDFKEWMDSFANHLPKNGTVFELGSATGRDARYFASRGYKVTCTDVIPEALKRLSQEGFETSEFDFREEPKGEWENRFDGFFANAVLLHAPKDVFEKAITNITKVLKENGIVAFSLKTGSGEEVSTEKMDAPRYFNYHNEEEIRNLLASLPFEIINISYAEDGKWMFVMAKRNNVNKNI
jgi:SAM-dependent methyltransferase